VQGPEWLFPLDITERPPVLKTTVKTKRDWQNGMYYAEANAISSGARLPTLNLWKWTLYIIDSSPCKECSKLIHQWEIKRVVYQNGYHDNTGLTLCKKQVSLSQSNSGFRIKKRFRNISFTLLSASCILSLKEKQMPLLSGLINKKKDTGNKFSIKWNQKKIFTNTTIPCVTWNCHWWHD